MLFCLPELVMNNGVANVLGKLGGILISERGITEVDDSYLQRDDCLVSFKIL